MLNILQPKCIENVDEYVKEEPAKPTEIAHSFESKSYFQYLDAHYLRNLRCKTIPIATMNCILYLHAMLIFNKMIIIVVMLLLCCYCIIHTIFSPLSYHLVGFIL